MKKDKNEVKEFAKKLAKLLRKNGVSCGNIRGNGTTEPNGADKYKAYFVWESGWKEYYTTMSRLYLNFEMDEETGPKIQKILDENKIPYWWDGKDSSAFVLTPTKLRICEWCEKRTQTRIWTICIKCLGKSRDNYFLKCSEPRLYNQIQDVC